jgi:beta-N-acetylhexosaminidase
VGASVRRAVRVVLVLLLIGGCRTVADAARHDAAMGAVEPQLGQLLLVGFHGTSADDNPDLERLLCQVRVGGVVLFARNIVDHEQVARLTRELADRARACTGRRLLIAVDAEGGQVMRLGPHAGYTQTLSHQELGDANDLVQTELEARRIGARLREAGINWNLAPVVDVGYNPANPVIVGVGRSFGANPTRVAAQARAFIAGMHAAGLVTALKHFPGHGSSVTDSHHGFVDVSDTANADVELAPYRMLMAEGMVDSVMTAHVFNKRLDRKYPATLSAKTVGGLLRRSLGWRGVVISDDLRMGAIEQHYGLDDAAVRTVRAGVDVVLIADDRLPDGSSAAQAALEALRQALRRGNLSPGRVREAVARIEGLRAKLP